MEKVFADNARLARELASEGIVLLKNDGNLLPLSRDNLVVPVGRGCFNTVTAGGGSEVVNVFYKKSIFDGLCEKEKEGKLSVYKITSKEYQRLEFPTRYLTDIERTTDTMIFSLTRYSAEEADRKPQKGEFYLSDEEEAFFDEIGKTSIKNVILILNISNQMDLSFIDKYPFIKSVLLIYLPGMEGGAAVADLICGDVTPSGKLADTFAGKYEDYPTSETFNEYDHIIRHEEDVFVGYRYFETIPGAKERVIYPFGYGMSYTDFAIKNAKKANDGKKITVTADVTNIGSYSGKEVLQVYTKSPDGKISKPARELRAFAKTKLLKPGDTQKVSLNFALKDMASFDDTGVTGHLAAFVLEKGSYEIFLGTNVRNAKKCGSVIISETTVCSQHKMYMMPSLGSRMTADGSQERYVVGVAEPEKKLTCGKLPDKKYNLSDVAKGKVSLQSFIAQLSTDEMLELAHGQPRTIGMGTAGIGNLPRYGIPNVQTADGASGFKRDIDTVGFPCSNLTACAFNTEIWERLGKARAAEAKLVDVDILLAPAMNIHRDPLCGRNFEYFSEDPFLAGKVAASIVKTAEKNGLPTTIKHFAANNREKYRKEESALISERALREIYLKGFEIAVKEAHPSCIMTSYNMINGVYPSENKSLLKGILRKEWGFDGLVMTDWWNMARIWREIKAGNNLRMPIVESGDLEKAAQKVKEGYITRAELEENTAYILKLILKCHSFRKSIGLVK